MPVPSTVADLSSTASSNYPSGSESIGTSLDDYLRAHASIIKQVSDAYIAADSSLSSSLTSSISAKQDASTAVTLTGTQTVQNKTFDSTNTFNGNVSGASGQFAGFRNKIINGGFAVNQRAYVSGAAVGANLYGHDRWKMAASGDTYTFSTTNNKTTVTIPAGKVLQQVVEGLNLQTGTYTLSWEGTAQGKIGAGSYGASGITGSITGGTNTTIEFGPGTVANVQLEFGSIATPFEHRPIQTELALCQRYYEKSYDIGTPPATATIAGVTRLSYGAASSGVFGVAEFKVPKRAAPTVNTWDEAGNSGRMSFYNAGSFAVTNNLNALAANWGGASRWGFSASTSTAGAAGTYTVHWTADAEL